jgi:hypothetical protein
MDGRCTSSGRAPALQVLSPVFKLQSHQKKKSWVIWLGGVAQVEELLSSLALAREFKFQYCQKKKIERKLEGAGGSHL